MDEIEMLLQNSGFHSFVGIDEVGRGPLAGPVVAAAVHIPSHVQIPGINDSKKLTPKKRELLYEALTTHSEITFGISVVEASKIDEINILQATLLAMKEAAERLPIRYDYYLVDGNILPKLPGPGKAIIQGDAKSRQIGAASIVAKVTRDRLLDAYHEKWPHYGFNTHKGYGTAAHLKAIKEHGPLEIHRMSFAPLKNC